MRRVLIGLALAANLMHTLRVDERLAFAATFFERVSPSDSHGPIQLPQAAEMAFHTGRVTPSPPDFEALEASMRRVMQLLSMPAPVLSRDPRDRVFSEANQSLSIISAMSRSMDAGTRKAAMAGLQDLGGSEAVGALLEGLADANPAVQQAAASSLNALEVDEILQPLLDSVARSDFAARARLASGLSGLGRTFVQPLVDILSNPDRPLVDRCTAAYVLGCMGRTGAADALGQGAWSADPALAVACTQALVMAGDPAAAPMLGQLTRHPEVQVRWAALQGLESLGSPHMTSILSEVLVGPYERDDAVRRHAAYLLGETGDPTAVPSLMQALGARPALSDVVMQSLRRVTGKNIGDRPVDWIRWHREREAAKVKTFPIVPLRPSSKGSGK
jgi:hypothetical protein